MFSVEQFDHLHSLWDGGAENYKDICHSCFGCCDKTEKIIYPGESKYLLEKTGQHSSDWRSEGCMCKHTGTKLVFCKMYPMNIRVDLFGKWEYLGIDDGCSSFNCANLVFKKDNFQKFVDFLFTDIHNILFHKVYMELSDKIGEVQKTLKQQRLKIDREEHVTTELLIAYSEIFELPFFDPYG